MTALYQQNGELFVGCRAFYVNCTICIQHNSKVQYTQTPHNISQFCRQDLWCRFPYSFRLSRAKGPRIHDDRGGTLLLAGYIFFGGRPVAAPSRPTQATVGLGWAILGIVSAALVALQLRNGCQHFIMIIFLQPQ